MLKKCFAIVFLFSFVLSISNLFAETEDCYVHIKVDPDKDPPGMFEWDATDGSCGDNGFTCDMIPCDEWEDGDIEEVSGGYLIHANLSEIKFKVKDEFNNWNIVTRNGNNYTFTEAATIRIVTCTAFPDLEGITLELEDITTDSNGDFSILLPTGSN